MHRLLVSSWRFFRQRPIIGFVTMGGIALGVAAVVAIDIATMSAKTAMRLSLNELYGESTHQIGGGPDGIPAAEFGKLRREFPELPIAPVIEGRGRLSDQRISILGLDLLSEGRLRSNLFRATATSDDDWRVDTFLTEADSIALSRKTANRLGLDRDDVVRLSVGTDVVAAKVVAVLPRGPDDVVLTDLANADTWLRRDGALSRIDINATQHDGALQRLAASLPASMVLVPTQARADATLGMTQAFAINLAAMSLLALLIGAFLIVNALGFAVVQRREYFATLRSLGVERRVILATVLLEACVFGVVGTVLGMIVGIALGTELTHLVARTINDLYFRVTVSHMQLHGMTVIKALVLGVGFSVLATLPAAVEAAATRPGAGLRRSNLERRVRTLQSRLLPIGCVVAALAGLVLVSWPTSLIGGLTALFLLVLAYAAILPALVVRVLNGAVIPAARMVGRLSQLAIGGVLAGLSRTGIAVVALTVAVAATVGVSTMVGSFRGSVERWLHESLSADIYVSAADGVLDDTQRARLAALQGVAAVGATRRAWLPTDEGTLRLQAIDSPAGLGEQPLLDGDKSEAWDQLRRGVGVIVSEVFANRAGYAVGDSLELPATDGVVSLPIVGIYRSYDVTGGAVLLSLARYRTLWQDNALDAFAIATTTDLARTAVLEALRAALTDIPDSVVIDANELLTRSLRVFDRTFVVTDVLYVIAVAIAVVGIVGALAALQLEQRTERATYRALGMTRARTGLVILGQSGLIGCLAGLAALPLGLGMAWLLIHVVNRRAFGWTMAFELDPVVLANAFALAVAAALVGGIVPAWQSARVTPAEALR